MSPEVVGGISFLALIGLLALRVPVGLAMIIVSLAGTALVTNINVGLVRLATDTFAGANNYGLSVIPMFIFMGLLLAGARLADDLYASLNALFGRVSGGLAVATIAASAMFGAVSGSATASASTIGTVAAPQMRRYGYSDALSAGSIAVGGTLGILIPPSAILVLYGILTEEPIGQVLIAGFIPGIMTAVLLMLTAYLLARFRPDLAPRRAERSPMSPLRAVVQIWPVLLIFGVTMGGIYLGIFTPTEAGAIGAFVSLLFSVVTRRLNWRRFMEALDSTVRLTAMIFLMVIGGKMFGYMLSITQIPRSLSNFVIGLDVRPYLVIAVIFLIYIVLGSLMEEIAILVIMTPIMYPIVIDLGYSGIWFGVLTIMMLLIGLVIPPVGLISFVVSGITKIPLTTVFRGVTPFAITLVIAGALVIAFPQIVMYLPNLMR